VKVVMLRHATRKREQDAESDEYMEKNLPLDSVGEMEARARAVNLSTMGINPDVYFTSCFAHARQTGEILRDTINTRASADVVELCTLTPHYQGPRKYRGNWRGVHMLETIEQEARFRGKDLRKVYAPVFILHQPRLQQLLAIMTSQDESAFSSTKYSDGVCVRADSLDSLFRGQGEVEAALTGDSISRQN
jgi:hypothetical protein